jgi:hypothetical protein
MESHSNFHDYGHFGDHNQAKNGSVYDGLTGGGVAEDWNFEDLRYEEGLNVNHLQPASVFEPENSSAQLSFRTEFSSSQPSSHIVFNYAGNGHFNSTWVPHEETESHNWLPTSNAFAVDTNFRQDINNGDQIAKSPGTTVFVSLHNVQSPEITSPSSITFQLPCNERLEPLGYASQQGFGPQLDEESRENPLYNNFLYVPPTHS